MTTQYIRSILDSRIYDLVEETPLQTAGKISARLNNEILLKREDLQPVFSFKIRGAYNKLLSLSESQRNAGVIAASAGNHAQGVAYAAKHLGIRATIVMPKTTPSIKSDAVAHHGADVVLYGDTFDEASAHSRQLADQHQLVYVHPYDDPDVIAGQGTIGMEILRQCPTQFHAIFIAVGGGGLCAGVAAYIKYVRPDVKIIAVEPEDSACLQLALASGKREKLPQVGLFADGVAVAQIGQHPFDILKDHVDATITVTTDELCAAIKDIFEDTRSIVEPAGALSVAGIKKYVFENSVEGQRFIGINCGANMNFDRLRYVSERTETGEKREAILAVTIPEQPGSFKRFCSILSERNISEFNYRHDQQIDAQIFVGIAIRSQDDQTHLVESIRNQGYPVTDLTDDEMAKLHVRHMVGGRAPGLADEKIFRFEFPERPGALMQFLDMLGARWNISMFHYRNHGAAYGRVLLGIQVPAVDHDKLDQVMLAVGYPYAEETENPAYQLFLR